MKKKRIIDVGAGVCPLGPSRKVKAAIRKAIKEIGGSSYGAVKRLERLFLSKYGIHKENVLFANSLRELPGLLVSARKPKKILIAGGLKGLYGEETYGEETEVCYLNSGEGSCFQAGPEVLVSAAMGAELVIISNPDRMTGRLSDERVHAVLDDLAGKDGVCIVVDESLMEFTGREGTGIAYAGKRNIITLRTTANYYGLPGLELAYAVSDRDTIGETRERRCGVPNILSLEAANTALRDTAYRNRVERFLAEEKKLLSRAFGSIDGAVMFDSDSNVYLLKFEDWSERSSRHFLRAGFLVRDCGPGGSSAALLRLSVLGHDKNVKFARLLGELRSSGGFSRMGEKDHRGQQNRA